ncbi:MAG: TetR/AcrR family transcriptional regulator [Desulfurococcales archaeon]|nr:TetR/AcrR family transcriptional regulator [Desulfurococcales archaeon]
MRRDEAEVRENIIKAAMKVFSVHGFFRAPVNLIAKEAGISKGLIFWYFRSKDELILEVASRSLPKDVIDGCLDEKLDGRKLLECIGRKYMDKYRDPVLKNLLIHTMSSETVYQEIRSKIGEICNMYTRELAKKVFGGDTPKYLVAIRTFLGSLMCYTLRTPKDIEEDEYLSHLIGIVYDLVEKNRAT